MKGLSASNLKYMRFFAQECPACTIGQQSADQLPWFHVVILITNDKPTIGLLLCKTKKKMVAEYALSGIDKPMGVAEYQLVRSLPKPLETCLPSIEELESHLSTDLEHKKEEI